MSYSSGCVETRTVLVSGFDSESSFNDFIKALPEDIILEHNVVRDSFLVFITFYDIRKSVDFYNNVNKMDVGSLVVKYTISQNELPDDRNADRSNNQASIIIHYKHTDVTDSEIIEMISSFGEVKECRMEKTGQKIFEYFDLRSAKKALDDEGVRKWKGGTVRISPVWDIMPNVRTTILKQTDELISKIYKDKNIETTDTVKKLKVSKSKCEPKNVFIREFDNFIINNLDAIEKSLTNDDRGN